MANSAINLTVSDAGVAKLKLREGLRTLAYDDVGGTRTIGYGHVGGVRAGERIDDLEAEKLLRQDLNHFQAILTRTVRTQLEQEQYDGLISFVYNIGEVAWERSDVLKHVNAADWQGASKAMLSWSNVKGRFNKGLYVRRKSEAAQVCPF